jgi:hypothetical protein
MAIGSSAAPVARLWRLAWHQTQISCAIYRTGGRFEVRLESPTGVILAEPFQVRPRAMTRVHALRHSLVRRGWEELPS